MKRFWSQRIQDAQPYVPGEQPRERVFIKLNTNENPYPPSPKVIEAVQHAAGDGLRLYPDPECLALRQSIANRYGLTPEQIFCGNGSDEVLAFCFQAFFDPEPGVLFADVTYSFYPVYARYFGLNCRQVQTGDGFRLPIEDYLNWDGGVVVASPNAPTGIPVAVEDLRRILEAKPDRVVIVDEAYIDFGGESAAALIDQYENLLVVQTLSKSRSLAGLRVGWAMGHAGLIDGLRCVRDSVNSYTVDRLAQAGAQAAIEDEAYFQTTCNRVIATRERVAKELAGMGFLVLPSKTNFLFLRHPDHSGKALLDGLREKGILVRWWSNARIDQYLRVSIGTDQEMDALTQGLKELI